MPETIAVAESPAPAPETPESPAAEVLETVAAASDEVVGSDVPEAIESPEDRLIDSVTASQQDAIDSFESATDAATQGFGLAHRAFTDFVAERLRQDFDTQRALMRSRSLEEARSIGFAHIRTAVDQYGREVSRMVRLGSLVAHRSLERPRFGVPSA